MVLYHILLFKYNKLYLSSCLDRVSNSLTFFLMLFRVWRVEYYILPCVAVCENSDRVRFSFCTLFQHIVILCHMNKILIYINMIIKCVETGTNIHSELDV